MMASLISEPDWILDRRGSGTLFWRRDCIERKERVKFRHDVEVLEFSRGEHEMETLFYQQHQPAEQEESNTISMGMTAIICLMVTVLLPWYLIGAE